MNKDNKILLNRLKDLVKDDVYDLEDHIDDGNFRETKKSIIRCIKDLNEMLELF